jgi:hypothetical protein
VSVTLNIEVKEKVMSEVIFSADWHLKKYGLKKMSLNELDILMGVKKYEK